MTAGASSQGTNPEPRPPGLLLGVKLHTEPRSHTWRVMGSGHHQAPPSSPGAEEGSSPQAQPLHPPPTSSSAPLLLFPTSTPLIHDFSPQSWAPLYNPSPATSSSRPTSLYQVMGRFPGFLDQTLTSLSSLATSLALLPEKPQVSRLQV